MSLVLLSSRAGLRKVPLGPGRRDLDNQFPFFFLEADSANDCFGCLIVHTASHSSFWSLSGSKLPCRSCNSPLPRQSQTPTEVCILRLEGQHGDLWDSAALSDDEHWIASHTMRRTHCSPIAYLSAGALEHAPQGQLCLLGKSGTITSSVCRSARKSWLSVPSLAPTNCASVFSMSAWDFLYASWAPWNHIHGTVASHGSSPLYRWHHQLTALAAHQNAT